MGRIRARVSSVVLRGLSKLDQQQVQQEEEGGRIEFHGFAKVQFETNLPRPLRRRLRREGRLTEPPRGPRLILCTLLHKQIIYRCPH